MKTIFRFIFAPMSGFDGTAVVEGGETLGNGRVAREEAVSPAPQRHRRLTEGGRSGLSIGVAIGLHALLGLVHVTHSRLPALHSLVQEAEFVDLEPLEVPVPPAVESPPPPPESRPVARPQRASEEPPPAEQPPPNPAVGAVVPDDVVPTPQVEVASSTAGGLAVNAVVGDGNGGMGSGSGTRHAGPAVEGTPVANAAPAHDPRPARRAYVQRVRSVVGAPRYSNAMRRRGIEGTVLVGVTIDARGHVVATRVKRSSGDAELDQMVLDYVRAHVASLPEPPPETEWQTNEVGLPYEFNLADD